MSSTAPRAASPTASAGGFSASVGGSSASPSTSRLVLGFGAVYLIWGSTYLAIRIAIETIPPFTMAGARFLTAGAALYSWARYYGKAPAPTTEHWRNTALLGALLLLAGNGAVVWAEQWVSSGLVALLVGMLPLWMVLVDWLFGSGRRPGPLLIGGLLWGMLGVVLLAGPGGFGSRGVMGLVGAAGVMVGNISWAYGSIRARRIALPSRMALSTAMQMLWGGAFLFLTGAVVGELGRLDPTAVSVRSLLATAYLAVFGSLIAFSAFSWLNTVVSPARVSTYAYVNPVVALFLGWALVDEPITGRTLLAALMILSAVALITRRGR
jgi:drug/metabolite transporter (DMT)-like permease